MKKNTLVWVGGSIVVLVGMGIAVKMIFFPSKEKVLEELAKYDSDFDVSLGKGMDYGYLKARLKANKNKTEFFFYKDKKYLTSTGRAV